MFKIIKKFIADLLFPIECVNCRRPGEPLCQACLSKIPLSEKNICYLCNRRVASAGLCNFCRLHGSLDEIYVAAKFKNAIIDKSIHDLKYNFVEELAVTLANFLALNLTDKFFYEKLKNSIIVPIPLHQKRYLERGFNQAELIAKTLSLIWSCPMRTDLLQRKKYTFQQALLNREARLENIKEAFVCLKPQEVRGCRIILIDDVLTSGATMTEAARVLKRHGAREICAVVLAHG